jgi:hypothetical protein
VGTGINRDRRHPWHGGEVCHRHESPGQASRYRPRREV